MTHSPSLAANLAANPAVGAGVPESRPAPESENFLALSARLASSYGDALTVINGHAALLLEHPGLTPEMLPHASAIYRAGEHAARLTRQLLIVSGHYLFRFETIDLHRLIADVAPAIRRLLGAERRVEINLAAGEALVWADPEMLEQLLLSLAENAAAALPPGGGCLHLTTERLTLSAAEAAQPPDARAGDFVRLEVRDDGCGMSPEVLARAGEPFFTGRATGRPAAGLGLAAVRSIVKNSQGWLRLDSGAGPGTTITAYLPTPAAPHGPAGPTAGISRPTSTTILLVDDEQPLRELTAMVLQSHGYRVLQASDGPEALEVWKWHSARIALLFTDLVMPGPLSGLALAAKLQAEKPGLQVICLTGNLDQLPAPGPADRPNYRFLQKPCSPQTVGQAVRALLAATNARAPAALPPPAIPPAA